MQAYEGRDYFLTLIEVSIQELEHLDGELHGEVWPKVLPPIDGVFCLYDASDRSSFIHVEELIRKLTFTLAESGRLRTNAFLLGVAEVYYERQIPYIVLACKSDLQLRIPPADASSVISRYDGGIVEISSNEVGRDKAKRCVGVLLRGVMRRRCK